MTGIFHLPHEVILTILHNLTPRETLLLIDTLAALVDPHSRTLSILLYQRLYGGKLLVVSGKSHDTFPDYDSVLSLDHFRYRLVLGTTEARVFCETRPKSLEFRLIRDANDYMQFVGDLYGLSQFMEECQKGLHSHVLCVRQLLLYVDANTVSMESPTSLLSAVLKALISATGPEILSTKFRSLTIKLTDLGDYYAKDWGQLLGRLSYAETLDLSDNVLRLDWGNTIDVLGGHFRWPPTLKSLTLDQNWLTYLSCTFFSSLPHSLEKLLVRYNRLVSFGCNNERFCLAETLPQLQELDLEGNHWLVLVNALVFERSLAFKRICVRGCNIEEESMGLLQATGRREGFVVEV